MDSETLPARIALWFRLLCWAFGRMENPPRRSPIGQLVKSLISSRTRDAVSLAAYRALGRRFGSAAKIAAAGARAVEPVIAGVTFPDVKAERLVDALRRIGSERPDYRLDFLGTEPLPHALGWLERLPGVGRKTAAATLNFSTLARPVFVADGHVTRVLRRLGAIGPTASADVACDRVTAAMPDWSAIEFQAFHAQLKHLGQAICRWDAPLCGACPLARDCPTAPARDDGGGPRWRPKLPARMG